MPVGFASHTENCAYCGAPNFLIEATFYVCKVCQRVQVENTIDAVRKFIAWAEAPLKLGYYSEAETPAQLAANPGLHRRACARINPLTALLICMREKESITWICGLDPANAPFVRASPYHPQTPSNVLTVE